MEELQKLLLKFKLGIYLELETYCLNVYLNFFDVTSD